MSLPGSRIRHQVAFLSLLWSILLISVDAWALPHGHARLNAKWSSSVLFQSSSPSSPSSVQVANYELPEDAVITIKPNAFARLQELRRQQKLSDDQPLVLRMGVRSGGCSGMSYVMDIAKEGDTIAEDDAVDEYSGVKCVVDAKSMLYLYGLELDYSDELVGGGFKFLNPNAEESCGCGSSFGV